eukprot:15451589-Alexandrium_andersonii.AAC.1
MPLLLGHAAASGACLQDFGMPVAQLTIKDGVVSDPDQGEHAARGFQRMGSGGEGPPQLLPPQAASAAPTVGPRRPADPRGATMAGVGGRA